MFYPLIRDIRIDVCVPTAIWDLRNLSVKAIELYDFPGFGAQVTSARDKLLAEHHRKSDRIHTWIVAVNSANLAGSQAISIIEHLRNECVIALASRFDDLPLGREQWREELDRLTQPDAPPGTRSR